MSIQKISIHEFIELAKTQPVLDVRSPGEFDHAHIPGAFSLPLFTDEERKVVGTAYKQQGRQTAIKIGLDYFGLKMKKMVEEVEEIIGNWQYAIDNMQLAISNKQRAPALNTPLPIANCVLLHCWRGGMRSAGVAWLLDLYGFKVYTLAGGYKTYRKWARDQFEKSYHLNVLGGYTGSGKTLVLNELARQGLPVINLEALANHKGSAFGDLGEGPQPTQEMFENLLAERLHLLEGPFKDSPPTSGGGLEGPAWIEDESQRIGNLQIPIPFWNTMRNSRIYFTDVPFEERLNYLTEEYGKFDTERLVNGIARIQKRLGGLDAKMATNFLLENNHKECFSILLKYYDKCYNKGLYKRDNINKLLVNRSCSKIDVNAMVELLINEKGNIVYAEMDKKNTVNL